MNNHQNSSQCRPRFTLIFFSYTSEMVLPYQTRQFSFSYTFNSCFYLHALYIAGCHSLSNSSAIFSFFRLSVTTLFSLAKLLNSRWWYPFSSTMLIQTFSQLPKPIGPSFIRFQRQVVYKQVYVLALMIPIGTWSDCWKSRRKLAPFRLTNIQFSFGVILLNFFWFLYRLNHLFFPFLCFKFFILHSVPLRP